MGNCSSSHAQRYYYMKILCDDFMIHSIASLLALISVTHFYYSEALPHSEKFWSCLILGCQLQQTFNRKDLKDFIPISHYLNEHVWILPHIKSSRRVPNKVESRKNKMDMSKFSAPFQAIRQLLKRQELAHVCLLNRGGI